MRQLSLLFSAAILLIAISGAVRAGSPDEFKQPDVLVLVMGGLSAYEQCSINYTSVVALPKAQADLDTIAALGKWRVSNPQGSTRSSGGPKPVPTTSITWQAPGIIGYAGGTLPLEPFVTALKRFKSIEVFFLIPPTFQFKGLREFHNRFVSIRLGQKPNSYRYRIVVKDNTFSKLDLPLVQPKKPRVEKAGSPLAARIALALGIGLLCAAAVYLIASYLSKRR